MTFWCQLGTGCASGKKIQVAVEYFTRVGLTTRLGALHRRAPRSATLLGIFRYCFTHYHQVARPAGLADCAMLYTSAADISTSCPIGQA